MFTNCKKGIHKFEARYDSEPNMEVDSVKGGSAAQIQAFFHGLEKRTYIHDICVKCGKTIKRGD